MGSLWLEREEYVGLGGICQSEIFEGGLGGVRACYIFFLFLAHSPTSQLNIGLVFVKGN